MLRKVFWMDAVTVQPGLCIHCTDCMKTQSLRASGHREAIFNGRMPAGSAFDIYSIDIFLPFYLLLL